MAEGRRAASARRFWDRYIKRLHEQGVKPPSDQWHVFRAERFIKAFPDKRLAEITAGEVGDYLARLGATPGSSRGSSGRPSLLYRVCIRL
jgi:hypothetical protein